MCCATRLRALELALRDGRGDGGDGAGVVAERAVGDRGDDRRVDAAGERDDDLAERGDAAPQAPRAWASLEGLRPDRSSRACR